VRKNQPIRGLHETREALEINESEMKRHESPISITLAGVKPWRETKP